MSDNDQILTVSGLTKIFGEGEAETVVLKGLDLSMKTCEMAALLGSFRLRQEHFAKHSRHPHACHRRQSRNAGRRLDAGVRDKANRVPQ